MAADSTQTDILTNLIERRIFDEQNALDTLMTKQDSIKAGLIKADDAAKAKRAEDFRKKENRRAESQGGGDFHSNMVAKAQERQKQTRAGQQAGKGYVGGFGFDKGGLMKRKK